MRCFGVFFVEDIESRQADIRDFFLTESNCRRGFFYRFIACRTNGRPSCAAREGQDPGNSQCCHSPLPRPSLRSLLCARQGETSLGSPTITLGGNHEAAAPFLCAMRDVVTPFCCLPCRQQFRRRAAWPATSYLPQSRNRCSSASRVTAGAFGFLTFTQCGASGVSHYCLFLAAAGGADRTSAHGSEFFFSASGRPLTVDW
jgi:hypothetical protein